MSNAGRPDFKRTEILAAQSKFVEFMGDGQWRTAKVIRDAIGVSRDMMRAMPMWENGSILALPQRGFCLTGLASSEDRDHCINTMRSRASEIHKRARAIETALGQRKAV